MLKAISLVVLLFSPLASSVAGTNRWSIQGPHGGDVVGLAFDEEVSGLVHAATSNGIFRSTDDGLNWQAVPELLGTPFADLVVAGSDARVLYASSVFGLYKSVDRGEKWSRVHGFGSSQVAVSQQNPDVVYSVSGNIPMRSSDGGRSFTSGSGISSSDGAVTEVLVDPLNSDIVYATFLSSAGVYKSVDGGSSWTQASTGLTSTAYFALTFDQSPSTLYAGSISGLFKSTDAAATWTKVTLPSPLSDQPVYAFGMHGGRLFVGSNGGLLRLSGASFVRVGSTISSVREIGLSRFNSSLVLAMVGFNFVRSTDDGNNFGPGFQGLLALNTNAIATDPNAPSVVYAASWSGTFKSTDRGATWSAAGPANTYLAVDAVDSQTLYGISVGAFKRSTDGGVTWTNFGTGLTGTPYEIIVDPVTRGILYTFASGSLFKKVGDAAWTAVSAGIPAGINPSHLLIDRQNPSTLYVGGAAIYKSTNGGISWASITVPLNGRVSSMALDPFDSNHLIVADDAARLLESKDAGATWSVLREARTFRFAFDPARQGRIYAINNGQTERSDDGGKTWVELTRSHPRIGGDFITVSPDGSTVYFGGRFSGVWAYTYGRQRPVR